MPHFSHEIDLFFSFFSVVRRDVILEDLKRDPNIEKKQLVRTMVSYLQSLLDSNPGEKQGASVSLAGIPEYEAYVPDPSRDADSEDDFVFGSEKPSKAKKLSKQKKKVYFSLAIPLLSTF